MSFSDVLTSPYYTGTVGVAAGYSGKVVSIADHWFPIDMKSDRFRYVSVNAMRPQADTSDQVGEQTLTRDGLWRRVLSSWHMGAGQHWFDRNGGDPNRFRSSRGCNPWEQWELSVLPDVSKIEVNATGWNSLTVGEFTGGQRLVATGASGKCMTVTPGLAETNVAAGLAGQVRATSTGSTVYVSDDTGIHKVDAGGTSVTLFNTNVNAADCIGFAKNRLLAGVGAALWDVIDGTTAAAHYTNPWAGWKWTAFAEGQATIYACGYSGDRGLIFSVPLLADATGLEEPRVVAELPHGEIPYAMVGYVGLLVIGTNKGVRVAQQDARDGLTVGAHVGGDEHADHLHECRALEPQDRFVWFGWDDTFVDAAGLGRIDLTRFVEPLAPAYATDLMGQEVGEVNAVTTFDDRRWFTAGQGLYREGDTAVGEAYVETGVITFNISDDKVAVWGDLRHNALAATESVEAWGRTLSGEYDLLGISQDNSSTRPPSLLALNHQRAVGHELKVVLKRGSSTDGPVLTGVTLAAQPAPERSFNVFLPLLIHTQVTLDDSHYLTDVPAEVAYIRRLVDTQQLVRFTSGLVTHLVFVEDYEWIPHHSTVNEQSFDGTVVVKLKSAELVL
jgi:hypothetical protein